MQYSITYLFVILLAALGVDNAEEVVDALFVIAAAAGALYGRYRVGGISWWGKK